MAKIHSNYGIWAQGSLDKFVDKLQQQIDDQYIKGTKQNMEDAIDLIEERSQELVPEDTGATKRSWFRNVQTQGDAVVGTFGYDRNGQLDYVPLIYVNGNNVMWRKEGASEYWLQIAMSERNDLIIRELSKKPK